MHDPAAIVREASVLAMGRVKSTGTDLECGWPVGACAGGFCRIGPAGGDWRHRTRFSIAAACRGLPRSSDMPIRRAAVRALLQVDSSQSVRALVAAGRDSDAAVRQGIVAAVGE